MIRKSTGKRLRFEVMKRDGFTCRYCGANASTALLHVDHVVPVAEGGKDDAANLITACRDCNLGKAAIPLEHSELRPGMSTAEMQEHAKQIRAYLAAVEELQAARQSLVDHVMREWSQLVNHEGMLTATYRQLPYWIGAVGLPGVREAIEATSRARAAVTPESQARYFVACMRNMRDRRAA